MLGLWRPSQDNCQFLKLACRQMSPILQGSGDILSRMMHKVLEIEHVQPQDAHTASFWNTFSLVMRQDVAAMLSA